MTYRVCKRFHFAAGHQLTRVPPGHKCARLHGHNYVVEVVAETKTLTEEGWVVDFADLRKLKDWCESNWDHRVLNDLWPFNTGVETTVENIAAVLVRVGRDLGLPITRVRVWESPDSYAEAIWEDEDE